MPSSLNSLWIYLQYHFTNNDKLQQYSLYAQKTPWITKKNIIKTVCILQYDRKERYRPDSPSWMRGSCGEDQQKEPSCYSSVYMYLFFRKVKISFHIFIRPNTPKKVFLLCKTYSLKQWLRDLLCSAIYCVPPTPSGSPKVTPVQCSGWNQDTMIFIVIGEFDENMSTEVSRTFHHFSNR